MHQLLPTAVASAALAAATVLVPGAAHAATTTFTDRAGDIRIGVDLRSVKVTNGEENVRVVSTHRDLVRAPSSGAGGTVFIDTDREDAGPEYALIGGYFEGTDYLLLEVEGWNTRRDAEPADCDYVSRIDYQADTVRSRFDQDCFDDGDIRVELRVSGARPGGGTAVDWLGTPRSFSPVVEQG